MKNSYATVREVSLATAYMDLLVEDNVAFRARLELSPPCEDALVSSEERRWTDVQPVDSISSTRLARWLESLRCQKFDFAWKQTTLL